MNAVSGYRVSLPSPDSAAESSFNLIAKGGIEFDEASTEAGRKNFGSVLRHLIQLWREERIR